MMHVEMYFDDGSNPSDEIVRDFIRIADDVITRKKQKVAVHCKAGLGRTGCLIGGKPLCGAICQVTHPHSVPHLQASLLRSRSHRVYADDPTRHVSWTAATILAAKPDEMGHMGERPCRRSQAVC